MAKFTKDEFISGLKEMTILEVNELVEAMKEEFGVDPSAVAVAAAPAADSGAADAVCDASAIFCGAAMCATGALMLSRLYLSLFESVLSFGSSMPV